MKIAVVVPLLTEIVKNIKIITTGLLVEIMKIIKIVVTGPLLAEITKNMKNYADSKSNYKLYLFSGVSIKT